MTRQARKKSSTGIYHVMLRGINKQNMFEDAQDRVKFLDTIMDFKESSNYEVYGYCLMDNHIHLLLREIDESLSEVIKRISSSYVYWYNKKYTRCGHLFQERFKSEIVVSDAYFLRVLRYIHHNPIKAGMTKNVENYKWSSYGDYIGGFPKYTDVSFALNMFSIDKTEAPKLFHRYMNEQNDDECMDYYLKTYKTDEEVMDCFNTFGLNNVSEIQRLNKKERDELLKMIKRVEGITVRQLARITGFSRSVIDRC